MTHATSAQPVFNVPGPRPFPLVGRAFNSLRFAQDSIGYTRGLFHTYGHLVALAAGGGTRLYSPRETCPATVFACGPDLVRQVTTQHEVYFKHPLTGPLYRWRQSSERAKPLNHFLVGLFGVNSAAHLQQRRLMLPAFHSQRLETYAKDMVAIAEDQLNQLRVGEINEMAAWLRQLTLRIVTKSLFGEDIGPEGESTGHIIQAALSQQGNLWMRLLPLDWPGLPWHRYLNLVASYEARMRGLIQAKRQGVGESTDVLSLLMQVRDQDSGVHLSEDELLGHVGVLFVAGHETSANALTWTIFLLSQHPQIMADLLDELEATLHGNAPTLEQLPRLPLLDNVVKESLRILPPVPWNGRVTAQPTELGGYALPTGTEVLVSIYQTHQLPELYADPAAFNPARWDSIHPDAYAYNPFSAGPRLCIGAGFAMLEIKIVLAMLLQRYRLQFVAQQPVDRAGVIVMTPRHGLSLRVHPQDREFRQGVGEVTGNVREMVTLP
ncbi:cytochrome P450 [filamentous cyanobacterium CCP3]|nr:cytochrome P450 [filamentous cyanobacterium CCP3]